jgi:hypothetical protein
MADPDYKRLLGEIAAKHGFHMGPDNPEWAIVTMSQGLLESTAAEIIREVQSALASFEEAAQKVQIRAGATLAQEVRQCAAAIRAELNGDIEAAGLKAREIVAQAQLANRTKDKWIMGTASLILALILVLIGVLLGRGIR